MRVHAKTMIEHGIMPIEYPPNTVVDRIKGLGMLPADALKPGRVKRNVDQ